MFKYRLFTPGPVPVSDEVGLEMARPIVHHRTEEFEKLLAEVREGLKWLFQTKEEVLFFSSSGTGAMEAAIANTLSPGDRAIVVDGGKFGERWWKLCNAYGVEPDIIKVEWGQAVDPAEIAKRLNTEGGKTPKAVLVQASESSTGVYHPIEEIANIVKDKPKTLLVVDAISALGAVNLPMDAWGIDILIGGSQKALALPPGLSFMGVSPKVWRFVETSLLPKFYFNLKREREALIRNQNAFTPAIGLVTALAFSLKKMRAEGLENIFARHAQMAQATRKAVVALGLDLFAAKSPVNSLTAVKVPPPLDGEKIYKHLKSKYNLQVAGGQDAAKGKIFRIAHMGFFDPLDIISVLAAVEWTLADLGHPVKFGTGLAAAMKEFANAG